MSFMKSFNKGFGDAFGSVGGLINGLTGVTEQTERTYDQQIKAMNAQNAYNTYMWNLANQYNTPQAQLARMAEAGIEINPTSYALGTGNLSNTAGVISSANGFSGSGSPAGNPISMAMGVAQGVQGIRESKARTAVDVANKDNLETRTENTKLENDILSHNLRYAQNHNLPVNSVPGMDASLASVMNEAGENGIWNTIKKYWNKNN